MDFMKEMKRESLRNLTWSDGDMFEQGANHDIFTEEIKQGLQFWKNEVYSGHEAVTYNGVVVYDTGNKLKTNQSTAMAILRGIKDGYSYNEDVYHD